MGYYVSPDSKDVQGASAIVNSKMNLTGKYVSTASTVTSARTVTSTEVLDLAMPNTVASDVDNATANDYTTSYNSDYYMNVTGLPITGGTVVSEVRNVTAGTSFSMSKSLSKYWAKFYKDNTSKADKVKAYASAFGLGILDVGEALLDGLTFVLTFGGLFRPTVKEELSDFDFGDMVKANSGANVKGAFSMGQTVGKILMCAGIVGLFALAGTFGLPVYCACAVVGALVGIGLAIDAGVTDLLPILWSGAKEGLSFFLTALGLDKLMTAINGFRVCGAFSEVGIKNGLANILKSFDPKTILEVTVDKFKQHPLKFILKSILKLDVDGVTTGGASRAISIVTFLSKNLFKVIDVIGAYMSSPYSGGKSFRAYLIKLLDGAEKITGCDDITGVFTAPAIDALSGKEVTGSSWVENVISSIPKIITLILEQYVGEVSQVI